MNNEPLTGDRLDEVVQAALPYLQQKSRKEQLDALSQFRPEVTARLRELLGIKQQPWEEMGVSRAKFYRLKEMFRGCKSQEELERVVDRINSGEPIKALRKELGRPPTNHPQRRAESAMRNCSVEQLVAALLTVALERKAELMEAHRDLWAAMMVAGVRDDPELLEEFVALDSRETDDR